MATTRSPQVFRWKPPEDVAYITYRNGAYLISLTGEATDELTPADLYDCARSRAVARRLAREMATKVGYRRLAWTRIAWDRGVEAGRDVLEGALPADWRQS